MRHERAVRLLLVPVVLHREPDAANTAIHALNARAGFVVEGEVQLPDKRALLSTCTREQWERSELGAAVVAR